MSTAEATTAEFIDLIVSLGSLPYYFLPLSLHYFLSKRHQNSSALNTHHIGGDLENKPFKDFIFYFFLDIIVA